MRGFPCAAGDRVEWPPGGTLQIMFTKQLFSGILMGLAFGMLIGAARIAGMDSPGIDARFAVPSMLLAILGVGLLVRGKKTG
jgi:hypothetical protein